VNEPWPFAVGRAWWSCEHCGACIALWKLTEFTDPCPCCWYRMKFHILSEQDMREFLRVMYEGEDYENWIAHD
jgi:hypothetical protein